MTTVPIPGHAFTPKVNLDLIPEFDSRSGNHYWIIINTYHVNPKTMTETDPVLLDQENLVNIVGPGCFYCEKEYTPLIAKKRCTGYA